MSTDKRSFLERTFDRERRELGYDAEETNTETLVNTNGITARSTQIAGEDVDVNAPVTNITFEDEGGYFSGNHGVPRPREFWTAKQLGQTPPMELIKIVVTQQLTGGGPRVFAEDDELNGAAADMARLIEDIYNGPHFQELTFDNLITSAVSDLIDTAFAYWEMLESENGEFPVAAFKPLPSLQIQHNINRDTGELKDDPAFWQVPFTRRGGTIAATQEPAALERDRIVVMRDPQSTRSNKLYGESIATKVREWIELIVDVDVHQKRHYSDSQLPAGFLHFAGSIPDEKLESVENDIIEASGDPHDLVTVSSDGGASWIPVGESVVDLEAIQEQEWYFKLVLAAAGLNANEIGMVEGSGFAKETPAMQRAVYKKVTKPMMGAIIEPQNHQAVTRITGAFDTQLDTRLKLKLERFDPVQEQIERQEVLDEWREQAVSLNELRGGIGRDAHEIMAEVEGIGEVNICDLPKYVVDLFLDQSPEITLEGMETDNAGPPDFDKDPILTTEQAFAELGESKSERVVRQLEETIDVQSSFIQSVAYARETMFLQIEFDAPEGTATYWYGSFPEWRFFNFLQSASKGTYFNRYIRHTGDPGFPYARVS